MSPISRYGQREGGLPRKHGARRHPDAMGHECEIKLAGVRRTSTLFQTGRARLVRESCAIFPWRLRRRASPPSVSEGSTSFSTVAEGNSQSAAVSLRSIRSPLSVGSHSLTCQHPELVAFNSCRACLFQSSFGSTTCEPSDCPFGRHTNCILNGRATDDWSG